MECRVCGAPTDLVCKWRYYQFGPGLLGLLDRLIYALTAATPICMNCLRRELTP